MMNFNLQTLMKYEKYPLDALNTTNYFDLSINEGSDVGIFTLQSIDDDTVHLYGKMNHPENVWVTNNCTEVILTLRNTFNNRFRKNTFIEWNITMHRIYGWFGQNEFQIPDELWGDIMWNTYSHSSLVEGSIQVDDQKFIFRLELNNFFLDF